MKDYITSCAHPTVAVVGLGKIGLPLAVQYAQHGWRVIGCDINPDIVDKVNVGQSYIYEEPGLVTGVANAMQQGLLTATLDTSEAVRQAEVVVVIVPVAIDAKQEVAFEAIDTCTASIAAGLQPGTLVIYETTLPIGTTVGRLRRILERTSNLKAGQDFYLAYSPERVKSGRIFRDLRSYPKIVGGINERSTEAAKMFYGVVLDAEVMTVASASVAEFVKLIETSYRDVNIALANELACFADAFGLDVTAAIVAANTQPESHVHTPGVGVGGHCIPVYPYFLFSALKEPGFLVAESQLSMLTLPRSARYINDRMAEYAVCRIEEEIGPLAGQSVLILGVAYRANVREMAFTSARLLRDALSKHGAHIYVDDPLFCEEELTASGYNPLPAELEGDIRAIIVQASHEAYQSFDFSRFARCQVLLDGRQALQRAKIEAAGIHYATIGDGNCAKRQSPTVL